MIVKENMNLALLLLVINAGIHFFRNNEIIKHIYARNVVFIKKWKQMPFVKHVESPLYVIPNIRNFVIVKVALHTRGGKCGARIALLLK
jgi:hypothetical protein